MGGDGCAAGRWLTRESVMKGRDSGLAFHCRRNKRAPIAHGDSRGDNFVIVGCSSSPGAIPRQFPLVETGPGLFLLDALLMGFRADTHSNREHIEIGP